MILDAVRTAKTMDIGVLAQLVNSAYRPKSGAHGWTHEADLMAGARTSANQIAELLSKPDSVVRLGLIRSEIAACVHIERIGGSQLHWHARSDAIAPGLWNWERIACSRRTLCTHNVSYRPFSHDGCVLKERIDFLLSKTRISADGLGKTLSATGRGRHSHRSRTQDRNARKVGGQSTDHDRAELSMLTMVIRMIANSALMRKIGNPLAYLQRLREQASVACRPATAAS